MSEKGYYVLAPYIELVGYKTLPFGIYNLRTRNTDFFNKELFEIVYDCDGETTIDPSTLSHDGKLFFDHLLEIGHILKAENGEVIESRQRYKKYDNRYKKTAHWSITGDCNYRCKHCFMSAPDAKFGHASFEQILDIIHQMRDCGIRVCDLTGGEPLIRDDFLQILDALKENDIAVSGILSNGALVNEKLLDELEKRNMHPSFQMSFDGVGYHDWMRGVPGAEESVLRAFRLLKDRGYNTTSSMVLFKDSVGTIRESVKKLGEVGCSFVKIAAASPQGEWLNHPEKYLTFEESLQVCLDYIPQYFEDGMPCGVMLAAGAFMYDMSGKTCGITNDKGNKDTYEKFPICGPLRAMIYISPEGTILPCQSMISAPIFEGYPNLFETPLKEILSDSNYIYDTCANVRDYVDQNPECKTCEYMPHCHGGCRAIAIRDDGTNFMAPDMDTCLFFKNGWFEKYKAAIKKYAPEGIKLFGSLRIEENC